MDRASSEFVRAISALSSRLSTQMGLIQKLQRTSNYDEVVASLQSQIDELKSAVDTIYGVLAEESEEEEIEEEPENEPGVS